MADRASEPSAVFWAVGIAASVALHAGVVVGAAMFAGRYAEASAPTEITFTDETSKAVDPLKARAERARPSEVARAAEQERLAPSLSAAASVKPETEALKPIATEVASKAEAVPARTAASPAEAVKPLQPAPADASSGRPETVAMAQPDQIAPAVPARTAPDSATEKAAAPTASATVAATQGADRLASSSAADTASAVPGDTVDRTVAEPVIAETADRAVIEQQPATADKAPAVAAHQPQPEAPPATSTTATAAPIAAEPAQRVAVSEQPASVGAATVADKPQPSAPAETVTALSSPVPGAETSPVSGDEVVTGGEPETVRPAAPDAAAGTQVASTPSSGSETSQPLAPSGETVTGSAPDAIVPTGSAGGSDGGSTAVAPSQPAATQAPEPQREIALLVPARPNSVLGNEVDKPSDRYRKIVDFIRDYSAGDCFIALPAVDLEGDVTFQTFGRDKAREDDFRKALQGVDQLRTEISSGDVADPQCLALSFARSTKRYPGFSLVIDLDEAEMASGTKLSGSVLNAEERDLHLLLVDDEGKVQSIDSYLKRGTGSDRAFSVPLTLTGGKPVATKQILLAITTDPPLPELSSINEPANLFFRRLSEEIKATKADVDLAVEGFNVR